MPDKFELASDGELESGDVSPAVEDVGAVEEPVSQKWLRVVPGASNVAFHVDYRICDINNDDSGNIRREIQNLRGVEAIASNGMYSILVTKGLVFEWRDLTLKIIESLEQGRRKILPEMYPDEIKELSPNLRAGVTKKVSWF